MGSSKVQRGTSEEPSGTARVQDHETRKNDNFNVKKAPRSTKPVKLACVRAYECWLHVHSQRARTTKPGLIDLALAHLAAVRGCPTPPNRLHPGADRDGRVPGPVESVEPRSH